jgi:hypothetical protein
LTVSGSTVLLVERIVAHTERADDLKRWLQVMAMHIRQLRGVHQLELLQNEKNDAEFVYFMIVDDPAAVEGLVNEAEWHQQFMLEAPELVVGSVERIAGPAII